MSVLYVFIRDGAEKFVRSTFSRKLQNFMGYGLGCFTFTLIDENVMQSFIGNCPVLVEFMASKCGNLPV
ncbi:hypothetical protein T06_16367 [Trichinella sp. T6]|nr:hypothetical protein T06_16367 [Trichinella sp. T6]